MTRVLHFSDIHVEAGFGGVPVQHFVNKRLLGLANLRLNRAALFAEAVEKMKRLERFVHEQAIDLCLCTGDLTALGTEPELRLARRVIEPFTRAPLGLVTCPGNHDIYVRDRDGTTGFEEIFGDLLGTDLPELSVDGVWPQVRLLGEDLAIVVVNSARPNPSFRLSSGAIPEAQLDALERVLDDPRVTERFVIVASHYAVLRANGEHDRPTHGLDNHRALVKALARVDRGLYVHGHVHHRYHVRHPGLAIGMCSAGSTTQRGREGLWVYEIEGERATATPGRFEGGSYVLDPAARIDL